MRFFGQRVVFYVNANVTGRRLRIVLLADAGDRSEYVTAGDCQDFRALDPVYALMLIYDNVMEPTRLVFIPKGPGGGRPGV